MSSSAAAAPRSSRNSTTGSLRIRRATGLSVTSSAQAATYHAFLMNIGPLREEALPNGRRLQIPFDRLVVEYDVGIVFRRVFDLLEVVQAAILVDAIRRADEAGRPRRVGVEVLADRVGRNVDHVAGFPLEALLFILRRPVVRVGDLD